MTQIAVRGAMARRSPKGGVPLDHGKVPEPRTRAEAGVRAPRTARYPSISVTVTDIPISLPEHSRQCGLQVMGYCLMTNHVHLVAVPARPDSLATTLRRVHSRYAQSFNQRYQRSGHLWQNRFFSCCLDRDHLVTALAYVDLNPVRAGMVGSAQLYPWSSARAHVEEEDPLGLIDFSLWRQVRGRGDWAGCLNQPPPSDATRRLREATQRGVPLGE